MEQQQMQLTPELVKDIEELIKDQKIEVKKGVLGILLQTGNQKSNRELMKQSGIIKYFFRYMKEESIETTSLTNLINYSQDKFYIDKIIELNGVDQIFEYLREVIEEVESSENKEFNEKQKLIIQLCVLLLLNISKDSDAQESFFQLKQAQEKQGRNMLYLLKMLNINKEYFKYFPNILANLSSNEKCRGILVENVYQIYENMVPLIVDQTRMIRLGALKTLRNCLFEYEKPQAQNRIVSPDLKLIDTINENQICLIQTTQFWKNDIPQEYQISMQNNFSLPKFQSQAKNVQQEVEELDLTIDILLTLSNIDLQEVKVQFDNNRFKYMIQVMKSIRKQDQDYQDQLDVLDATY